MSKRQSKAQSFVYFIKPAGFDGPIKIGCSQVPERRLIDLTVWSPWPLELVGAVKGTNRDEVNFHNRFKDCHSHREWFHSTPLLRATITAVLRAGDFSPILHLPVIGAIRNVSRKPRTESARRRISYAAKVRCAQQRMRNQEGAGGIWRTPDDVVHIIDVWRGEPYQNIPGREPSMEEMVRIHEYLAHPEIHSIRWKNFRPPPAEKTPELSS